MSEFQYSDDQARDACDGQIDSDTVDGNHSYELGATEEFSGTVSATVDRVYVTHDADNSSDNSAGAIKLRGDGAEQATLLSNNAQKVVVTLQADDGSISWGVNSL